MTITRNLSIDQLPSYLTIAEVSDYLGTGEAIVRERIRQGQLPAARFGRMLRIRREDLEAALEPNKAIEDGNVY